MGDLGWGRAKVKKALQSAIDAGLIEVAEANRSAARWLRIIHWWDIHPPQNQKHAEGLINSIEWWADEARDCAGIFIRAAQELAKNPRVSDEQRDRIEQLQKQYRRSAEQGALVPYREDIDTDYTPSHCDIESSEDAGESADNGDIHGVPGGYRGGIEGVSGGYRYPYKERRKKKKEKRIESKEGGPGGERNLRSVPESPPASSPASPRSEASTQNPEPSAAIVVSFDAKAEEVRQVIEYYKKNHPRAYPRIHSKQPVWRLIRDRLTKDGFSVEDLCTAIDGCHAEPWNCGQNPDGKKYQSLDLIVRSATKVSQFIETAERERKKTARRNTMPRYSAQDPPSELSDEDRRKNAEMARQLVTNLSGGKSFEAQMAAEVR